MPDTASETAAVPSGAPAGSAVTLDRVSFGYDAGRSVIHALSLDVRRGRTLAVLGPNGSGKTTLLELIAGALRPDAGHVRSGGDIGYVPQLTQVSFAYTVLEMVLMGRARHIGLFATPSRRDEAAAADALDRVGLLAFAERAFDTLSGGERQLVLFARALASEATILVLDEPTASLDLAHQRLVLQQMWRLCRTGGMTVIFSTHQPEHAAAVADDVALMFGDGRGVAGPARATLTADRLTELFAVRVREVALDRGDDVGSVFVPIWDVDGGGDGGPSPP